MPNDRRDTKRGDRRRATVILKGFKGPLWVRENCRCWKLSIDVSTSKAPIFLESLGTGTTRLVLQNLEKREIKQTSYMTWVS